ncbi:hypothetical protein [Paenibacillus macerans]|uniref:hypothetical protein n=1 Tax=Paenibacillus macerans TaxID=44252 RepID=UPI003D317E35
MSFGDPWFYIVLLGAAALVYALLLPGRQSAANSKTDTARDLEATLEQYMSEIEKENEELIALVSQMKQDFSTKQLAQQEQITELRQRLGEAEISARQSESRLGSLEALIGEKSMLTVAAERVLPTDSAVEKQTVEPELVVLEGDPQPTEQESDQEHVRDRYPELFEWYDKGKSIDMIAKAVGLQRGEVQLILQLAKKEESR